MKKVVLIVLGVVATLIGLGLVVGGAGMMFMTSATTARSSRTVSGSTLRPTRSCRSRST